MNTSDVYQHETYETKHDARCTHDLVAAHLKPGLVAGPVYQDAQGRWGFSVRGERTIQSINLAIGRIFRMGARPTQPGDIEEYEQCRALIMDLAEANGMMQEDQQPHYARDYRRGAQGD